MISRYFLCGLFLCITAILPACHQKKSGLSLKLAHGLDVSHPVHKSMVFMAERLSEKSDGNFTLEIYPSQQLGSERECLELLQIGAIAMTKSSASVVESFAPKMKALSLPYLFEDKEHYYEATDGQIGEELLLSGEQYWLRGLCFYDAGARSYYTKDKPIHTPADLEGLKIRVQPSNTALTMVRSMGAAATPIAWGELYTALQQGVVDGAENNPPSFYTSRHYEVCKYYTINEHTFVPDVLLMSTHWWKKLSEQQREWLMEAVRESVTYQRKLWAEAELESINAVKEAGVNIIYPDKQTFANKVEAMFDQYQEDENVWPVVEKIKSLRNGKN